MLPLNDAHAELAERELPLAEGIFGRGSGRLFPVKGNGSVLAAGDDALRQIDGLAVFALRDIADIEQVLQCIVLFYPEMPQGEQARAQKQRLGRIFRNEAHLARRKIFFRQCVQELVVLAGGAGKIVQRLIERGETFARGRELLLPQKVAPAM